MEKYKNKYRIASARLQSWDYGWNAAYFVTICTHNREHFFGEIVKTQCISSPSYKMQLSEIGEIVKQEWIKSFEMRPDMNLEMGEFIVMPNHFHAIIIIGDNEYNTERGAQRGSQRRDAMHCVSTNGSTTPNTDNTPKNKFGPQSKNLASIIRGFKSSVTTNVRKNGIENFKWQSRFYEHIIRNEKSFDKIQNYIINNPVNWVNDKFNNGKNKSIYK